MERVNSHDEVPELLGAYALDAVEPDEAEAVERHLEECPRCRDELRNHREVVGMLAHGGEEAPAGLWDRIVEGIHDRGTASTPTTVPMVPALPRIGPAGREAQIRGFRGAARRAMSTRLMAGIAAAAVVAIAVLGVQVVRLQDRTDHLNSQVRTMADQPTMASVQLALAEPGAKRIVLRSAAGAGASVDAVVLPSGAGYLYAPQLTPLPPSETYQLWGVVAQQEISYGLIGSVPAPVIAFRAGTAFHALAVTAEEDGGVVTSSHSPVAIGYVT